MSDSRAKLTLVRLSREERLLLLERFELSPDARTQMSAGASHPREVWLTMEEADDRREAVQDMLQVEGFDENYAPTPLGRLLEGLVDKLYTG